MNAQFLSEAELTKNAWKMLKPNKKNIILFTFSLRQHKHNNETADISVEFQKISLTG